MLLNPRISVNVADIPSGAIIAIISSISTFIVHRLLNQWLDKHDILSLSQLENLLYKTKILRHALKFRIEKNLMIFSLSLGFHNLASFYVNRMKSDFYNILGSECKQKTNFKSIDELTTHESSAYWTKIIQYRKLAKDPIFQFILFYPLFKQVKK